MIALTFDVDCVDWIDGGARDELAEAFPTIRQVLEDFPHVRTTWFVRIDQQMSRHFGRADHVFVAHAETLRWLRERGHEVGWHHHATRARSDKPVDNEKALLKQLARYSDLARTHGCTSVRCGWGQHTASSLAWLDDAGWHADSSAMPRPCYDWDAPLRDWTGAPSIPYFPSRTAPAREGHGVNALSIVEVPMSVVAIAAPTDTLPGIQRYLNLAYHAHVFRDATRLVPTHSPLVAVCHPYELLGGRSHPLYAFSMDALRANITLLEQRCAPFVTVSDLANATRIPWCHADAA